MTTVATFSQYNSAVLKPEKQEKPSVNFRTLLFNDVINSRSNSKNGHFQNF